MSRTSPVHYILPTAIEITPNANDSFNDLAVYIAKGTKIRVYSPRAGVDMQDGSYREWTFSGRNRRLSDSTRPYTIYARLSTLDDTAYLVFAPMTPQEGGEYMGQWTQKYSFVTPDGMYVFGKGTDWEEERLGVNCMYVRLGDVSLPVDGKREVTLDTGILGTEQFNNEWAVNPDDQPLRVEIGCTIDDEDAGPTPYVRWDKSVVLSVSLMEGWTGTDISRFEHWEITRNTGDAAADEQWNHPTGAGSYHGLVNNSITLQHTRDANDDFNGAVSALFKITAWGRESASGSSTGRKVRMVSAQINILAESLEQYKLVQSSSVVGFNPQTEEYTPQSVAISIRSVNQSGTLSDMTKRQVAIAGLALSYAAVDSDVWTPLAFSGPDDEKAVATVTSAAFAAQKSINVRMLNSENKEIDRVTVAFVRDGEDSREREWIFLRSQTAITFGDAGSQHPRPSLINSGEVNPAGAARSVTTDKNQDGWVPTGWWDEQQGISDEYPYEYGAYRDYISISDDDSSDDDSSDGDAEGGHWGDFSTPQIWNHYGRDGELYVINTNIDSVMIPADQTSAQATVVASFIKQVGSGNQQSYLCHFAAYRRHAGVYTRFAASGQEKEDGRTLANVVVSNDSASQNFCDAIVIFISNSALSGNELANTPPSSFLTKKEIPVIKAGDTGPKGDDGYSVVVNPSSAVFDEMMVGSTAIVDTSAFMGRIRVLKGSIPQEFKITYGAHSNCVPADGSTPAATAVMEATEKFRLIKNEDDEFVADGYLKLTVVTTDRQFSSEIEIPYHLNLLGTLKRATSQWFISKEHDDTAQGFIRFIQQAAMQAGITIGNDYRIDGNGEAILKRIVLQSLQSPNYVSGLAGWHIDQNGNIEAETMHLRSALEVDELRINRQQAQEGDTIFAENDQIESVEEQYDEAQDVTTYILTLKEKWEGYFTAQQYGNILRGKINTLAAKEAGVSDYTGQEYQTSQQEDEGGNKYYTSFMQVIATHNTDPQLGVNHIRVVLFGDSEVPMTRNYPPCALMAIARWGCIDYSAEYEGTSKYADVVRSIQRRQQSFMIFSSDGRIVKLTGVDQPILRNGNYGTTLGILPEFVQNYPTVHDRMIAGRDYLYAQGVVVGDFIKIDVEGNPIPTVVDKGEWQNNTPYFYNKFNETTQQYETHRVRHNGGTWQCLQSQPVISGGVATYYEPKWNSPYWMLVDGNDNLTIEFVSSKGYSFRRGNVDTVITPHLFYGNVDITSDVAAEYWNWTRESESGKTIQDKTWDAQHQHMKQIQLTNLDMPSTWSTQEKAIFTCAVTLNDGKTTRIVDNQIIS